MLPFDSICHMSPLSLIVYRWPSLIAGVASQRAPRSGSSAVTRAEPALTGTVTRLQPADEWYRKTNSPWLLDAARIWSTPVPTPVTGRLVDPSAVNTRTASDDATAARLPPLPSALRVAVSTAPVPRIAPCGCDLRVAPVLLPAGRLSSVIECGSFAPGPDPVSSHRSSPAVAAGLRMFPTGEFSFA